MEAVVVEVRKAAWAEMVAAAAVVVATMHLVSKRVFSEIKKD